MCDNWCLDVWNRLGYLKVFLDMEKILKTNCASLSNVRSMILSYLPIWGIKMQSSLPVHHSPNVCSNWDGAMSQAGAGIHIQFFLRVRGTQSPHQLCPKVCTSGSWEWEWNRLQQSTPRWNAAVTEQHINCGTKYLDQMLIILLYVHVRLFFLSMSFIYLMLLVIQFLLNELGGAIWLPFSIRH